MRLSIPIAIIIAIFPISIHPEIIKKEKNYSSSCTEKNVNAYIKDGKIDLAYREAGKIYNNCPEKKFAKLYAKLAFWNKDTETAYGLIEYLDPESRLYRQIYASKIIQEIKRGGNPKIPIFLKNDYDVLMTRIQVLIKDGKFQNAYRLSRQLYLKYHSRESVQLQANLLFWMEKYEKSLNMFKRLNDEKHINEIRRILLEKKLEKTNGIIWQAWLESDRVRARKAFDTLSEKERKAYRKLYRDNACRMETTHMLGIGFEQISYSDHRYRDHTDFLEFTLPIRNYTVYGRIEQTDRYGLKDEKLSVELYPPGQNGYWGYASFSVTPDADFYSIYSSGAYIYKEFERNQIGVGYLYSHYKTQDSHVAQVDFAHYLSDYMTLRGVYYHDFSSNSYAIMGEWRYSTPCHLDIKGTYVYSSSNEMLQDTRLLHDRGHNAQFYLEYPLYSSFSIGGKILWQQSLGENHYTTRGLSLFFRSYW
jgi:YaiO family outer membrane protein